MGNGKRKKKARPKQGAKGGGGSKQSATLATPRDGKTTPVRATEAAGDQDSNEQAPEGTGRPAGTASAAQEGHTAQDRERRERRLHRIAAWSAIGGLVVSLISIVFEGKVRWWLAVLSLVALGIVALLVMLRPLLRGRVAVVVAVFLTGTNASLLALALFLSVSSIITERRTESAQRTAAHVANVASLTELDEYLEANRRQLAGRAGRERLQEILADTSLSYAQRGNAAICLAQLGDGDVVKKVLEQAFAYEGDPSLRWWVLGAAPLWVGEQNLPTLLELANSKVQLALSGEAQTRSGAIAALGIAGPAKFRDKKVRSDITAQLLKIQKDTLGRTAGLDNLLHWALQRFEVLSYKGEVGPGRPPAFGWYHNLAGLTIVRLKDVKLETPGETQTLDEYYLGDTEVTIAAFTKFVEATGYETTAEQNGVSWGLDFNYQWSELKDASWRQVGLPGSVDYSDPQLPVVHVSWVDAAHFCNWLSELEGLEPYYEIENDRLTARKERKGYRLPTRAEWTCAALADTRTSFWWGWYEYLKEPDWREDSLWSGILANLPDRSIQRMEIVDAIAADDGFMFAAPAASFCPNPLGFFDIIGNVAEWCDWDEWDTDDKRTSTRKPIGGGSWGDELRFCTWRHARDDEMTSSHVNVGFRVARSAE